MNKKFISVFMMGAATLAPLSTLVSCSDYDDDINNLQAQIDASGVNLKEEVSKLQKLLDECKVAAEKADADLEQAIKNATNDAKGYADIQAEQAKQAAIAALQAQLSQAIADLENGAIADAKARAEQAYNLAEQTSKLANSNKAELEKLAKELETVNTDLQKAIEALQTRMTAAEAAIAEVKTQAAENKAQLTTLETTLNALKASNETAHNALSDKDDELAALIAANKTEIEGKLANEVSAINTKLGEVNTAISALEGRVGKNESDIAGNKQDIAGIKQDIADNIKPKLNELSQEISSLKTEIQNINKYLDILNQNLNNLITGLIFQDEQLEMVQAKVVADVNKTGITEVPNQTTFSEQVNGQTVVYFPYKQAAGMNTLVAGKWNVEKVIGNVYYTINPTDVNFTDKANIALENSNMVAPANLAISAPQAANRQAPIKRSADAPKNGLYQSTLTNSNVAPSSAHPGFANSYALFTSYQQKDKDGNVATKKVYSEYALNINVTNAVEQTAPAMAAYGADASHPAGVNARFTKDYGQQMGGTFVLLPTLDEFGKAEQAGSSKVYQKYVEVVDVTDSRNNPLTPEALTNAKKAINDANVGTLNTILTEESANFDTIQVNIPDSYTGGSLIGSTVTFRYFIQNYNGTIYSQDYKVIFVKTLFEESTVTIEHTPYDDGENDTKHGLAKTDKTDFQTEANCITVAASNTKWTENTSKIVVKAISENGKFFKMKKIEFWSNSTTGPGWIGGPNVKLIQMNDGPTGTADGLQIAEMQQIKNMTIVYDPALNEVEHEYKLYMESYDVNNNLISVLPIKFTMKYDNHHASLIKPNPAYFAPYNHDLKTLEDLRAQTYTLTAWANKNNGDHAMYNISQAFNKDYSLTDGCVMSFELADRTSYTQTNGENKAYEPYNRWRLTGAYDMEVPAKAVAFNKEHVYGLELAVQQFGVQSLWYNPVTINVIFKSAIAHADLKFNKETYEVEYPDNSLLITEDDIKADDKSTSAEDDIKYFVGTTSRDARIKAVTVELVDTQFASLFKSYAITNNGILIETAERVPGGVGGITTQPIAFKLKVTDFYKNTVSYDFKVKVKENQN